MLAALEPFEARRRELVPEAHFYLEAIGVHPRSQGRGLGAALLQPVLDEASKKGVPVYLETETADNVDFYARRGFRVVEEHLAGDTGCPIWLMAYRR